MPLVHLTRRYRFSAAHRLHSPLLSDEQNRAVYGKCNNPFGHGHDYTLEVTVAEDVDPALGRALPVATLDALVQDVILQPFAYRNLNTEVSEFAALVPTTEVLAEVAATRLAKAWQLRCPTLPARLEKVRIWETKRNIFEVAVAPEPREEIIDNEIIQFSSQAGR